MRLRRMGHLGFRGRWRERQEQIRHSTLLQAGPKGLQPEERTRRSRPGLFFAEYVAHTADLGADAAEFFFEVLVAAIEVIDAVENGFSVGDEGGEYQGRGGAK